MIYVSWQEALVVLYGSETVEELWAALIGDHGMRSTTAWDEALTLFRKFHEDGSEHGGMTALLLCTDNRWRRVAHRLIRGLADSGLLTDDELDVLAEEFTQGEVTIGTTGGGNVSRQVWPPLRRWAAARLVTNDGSVWRGLLDAASTGPKQEGVAFAAGVMDAADAIPIDERMAAIEEGLAWGSGVVRLAALPALARLAGDEVALRRAQDDPSEKVRGWSPTTPDTAAKTSSSAAASDDLSEPAAVRRSTPPQASLFDELPLAE